jgi:hypothetical protein
LARRAWCRLLISADHVLAVSQRLALPEPFIQVKHAANPDRELRVAPAGVWCGLGPECSREAGINALAPHERVAATAAEWVVKSNSRGLAGTGICSHALPAGALPRDFR